jgi:membrane associated rhomboid family serine protease
MGYSTRSYVRGFSSNNLLPLGVRWLLISNVVLFLLYFFGVRSGFGDIFLHFGLVPVQVVKTFAVWQLFTYMFLHDPNGFGHILFNMLTLWMFGKDLEAAWGTRKFLKFYFLCGVGAGVCVVIANYLFGSPYTRTIGASGAIYGLLMAFGVMFPDVQVLFSFLFPIKAKYFVAIIGGIAFLSSFNANSGVSNVAHLGGMLFGYVFLKSQQTRSPYRRSKPSAVKSLTERYKEWKLQRAKRKFQVYLRKHGGQDPWIQ